MENRQNKDLLDALIYAHMVTAMKKALQEKTQVGEENISYEANQLMKEIEHFNLMNAIDRALDERDEKAFMQLTGKLNA